MKQIILVIISCLAFIYTSESYSSEPLAAEIEISIKKLLKAGRSMEVLRYTTDRSTSSHCGIKMHQNQKKARQIEEQAKLLPIKYIYIKASTVDIIKCVSCSDSALKACDRVVEYLQEQKNIINLSSHP